MNKRFTYVIDNGKDTIYDLDEKGLILENFIEIQDMLNLLNDENEQLKEENKQLKQALKMEEEEAEVYNLDTMSYQTLYEQQLEKNKKINQLIKKIEDNLNKYELVNRLEYKDWKKEIWED